MTVKKLFARTPVKVGSYRLKLSADGGSKLLGFKVVTSASPPSTPPGSGPTGNGSTGGGSTGGGDTTPTGSAPTNTALPIISGTTTQGQTLTTTDGVWGSSALYTYQWRRCDGSGASCADISSATAGTYTLVYADAGSTIRVVVTASNSSGSASATSSQTVVVLGLPPANTDLPAISGTTTQGETLNASNGSWDNSPTDFAYQWQRCDVGDSCSDISLATSASYILVPADVDSTILVVVTASNAYGSSSPAISEETDTVGGLPPSNTSLPIISGTSTQDQTLTTTDGTWDNTPTDFAYQWQR
jgi:hypothetical protein